MKTLFDIERIVMTRKPGLDDNQRIYPMTLFDEGGKEITWNDLDNDNQRALANLFYRYYYGLIHSLKRVDDEGEKGGEE